MDIILETKNLVVKAPCLDDLDHLYQLFSDQDVMQYIGNLRTKEDTKQRLEKMVLYHKKYGYSIGHVYEKQTGRFIGRSGLIHLEFNENQPEIEVGYILLKEFWKKGYATELAKAFIHYGFHHLKLPKIVAVIRPENEGSRHVLEKSGMHYVGRVICYQTEVAKYEILKNEIDVNLIQLQPASLNEYPVIQNMARFYVYDMSEYFGNDNGWIMPENGLYECIDFKKYWQNDYSFPFIVRYGNELAGFAIVDKNGSDPAIDFNMAQFFIIRKFKHKGIAREAAFKCFNQFKGTWEVMVIPGNEGAYRFWRRIILKYTHHQFIEYTKNIEHFNNAKKNIFKFNTMPNKRVRI